MATLSETIWVRDRSELDTTVRNLIAQGGQVQEQGEEDVTLFLKKKMNVLVLVIGLLLCLVPGIVYLIWYSTADQSQQITVRIGQPGNLGTGGQTHWYDDKAPRAGAVPPTPATSPAPDAAAVPPSAPSAPPAPPTPPVGEVPPTPVESPAPDATAIPPSEPPAG